MSEFDVADGSYSHLSVFRERKVKARLQAPATFTEVQPNAAFRGPMDALLRTYRHEGFRALYGGFGAVILGGTPGTVLYLTSYAAFRDSISSALLKSSPGEDGKRLSKGKEFAIHFLSGMLAEAVACVIYVPVDVVKERMQVQRGDLSIQGDSQNYKDILFYKQFTKIF